MRKKISTKTAIIIIAVLVIIVGAGALVCYIKILGQGFLGAGGKVAVPTPSGKTEKIWACGSLHTHIMIFEDEKQNKESLEEVIAASKKLGFKFIMLSEKGPTYNVDSPGWKNMIKECDKNTSKDFICLSGQENCTLEEAPKKPKGHFVIIENKNYIPEILDVQEVIKEAHKQGSIVIVAHPFYKEDISDMYNYDSWDILDWEAMEVLNGVIDQEANEKALKKVYELWNKGIKKSLTGGADFKNHKAYTDTLLDPEEVENKLRTGYTCLYLDELNRENIIKAIKYGSGYASSGVWIKQFSVNGAMMGQTFLIGEPTIKIKIDLKTDAAIKKVLLIGNGEVLKEFNPGANEFTKEFSIPGPAQKGWYGLEVYAAEGKSAFANAIWAGFPME